VKKKSTGKKLCLKEQGMLNAHPELVKDQLFLENDFFDPQDLLQVKYEMIRKVERAEASVTSSAQDFGFSRLSFYRLRADFKMGGLAALIPERRGPREAHKLTEEIMVYLENEISKDKTLKARALSKLLEQRFVLKIHPRSVERALARRKKKI
jgi:transposase